MKLSKFVALAKRSGYCKLIQTGSKETWLALRHAVYKADGLPEMHGEAQARAVLDVPEKTWNNIFFEEETEENSQAIQGVNLSEGAQEEIQTEKIDLQVVYGGKVVRCLRCDDGQIVFYDETLAAPVYDVIKDSDYAQVVVRKDTNGKPVIIIKDGFEPVAAIKPIDLLSKEFLTDLAELDSLCVEQYERNCARKFQVADAETGD